MSARKINSINERIAVLQLKIRRLQAERKVAIICEKQRNVKLRRKEAKGDE